jgi:chromate transporter
VWTSAIHGGADFGLALTAFVALVFWRAPPWAVVLACGVGGAALAAWL